MINKENLTYMGGGDLSRTTYNSLSCILIRKCSENYYNETTDVRGLFAGLYIISLKAILVFLYLPCWARSYIYIYILMLILADRVECTGCQLTFLDSCKINL